jgi:nucleotide-binding universal stress UspA family protein
MLRRLAVEIAAGYDVAAHVELPSGDPVETLGRISQRAQLLVLGARGGGGFGAWRVGRTVRRVLDAGRCPVLVVKTPVHSPYRRVLVPVDFDAGADAALLAAARIAGGASIQVFHAIDSQREAVLRDADVPEHVVRESRLTEEAGVAARIRRKVAGLGLDPRRFGFAVAHGPAVRSTLRQALAIGADLVVAGTRGRAGAGRLFARSVGRRVLSRVGCDMLTVAQAPDEARSAAARLGGRAAPPAAAAFAGATVRAESAQDAAALPPAWSTR